MVELQFASFETPIGTCGLAWSVRGIVALQLPEETCSATEARLLRALPQARRARPADATAVAVEAILALLEGEPLDLREVALDDAGIGPFERSVYQATRAIGPGTTATYGEIAGRIGEPGAARAVGRALGRNPFAIVVPCHRVLAAAGRIGGFSAGGGAVTKRRILAIERARIGAAPDLFSGAVAQ